MREKLDINFYSEDLGATFREDVQRTILNILMMKRSFYCNDTQSSVRDGIWR